ncbi:ABC transporter permease [Bacillus sp. FJAT-45037]|uniref:ABC transporter permease n=1 Tax=Bacillus sp. FJAT-45037 TaxID=2011007 RepID=UPI000C241B20|nr:ABC-2 transporter permease [Bacillus sp. FJAT-45037]
MWKPLFSQTGSMIRFILRRDRIRLSIWIVSLFSLTIATAASFINLYQNELERQAIAETMRNPAMIAMIGQGYGLDNYTEGAMMAHQMLLFTAIAVAIMSILLVVRHTRADEEEGRIELLRSLPVGKLSNLSSTLVTLFSVNILLALFIGFGLASLQIESMDLQSSLLYGSALGATGMFFAAVTALFAQLSENSRGAIGYSLAFLGIAYLIRAVGDVSNEALSWISPLGWILGTQVYVNNYWWPILLTIGAALVVSALAFYLQSIRDMESGFIASKPGRRYASKLLLSPMGLAFRLQRTSIIAWGVGVFVIGVSYGSVFGDLESFFTNNEMLSEMLPPVEGLSLTEQFLTMLMAVMSMICTVPALLFMLKLKGEERRERTEHLFARAVSRTKVLGSYLVLSVGFGLIMLLLSVLGLFVAASAVMEDAIAFDMLLKASMVYLPAIWLMIGIAVATIGLLPKLTGLTWLILGYSFVVVYLGGLMQFPSWMAQLSPFGHIPEYPVEELDVVALSLLTVVAIVLIIIGFIGYKKRDLEG